MRVRPLLLAGGTVLVVAAMAAGGVTISQAATGSAAPAVVAPQAVGLGGAPYIFPATSNNPNPMSVMQTTHVKAFTLAFMLSKGSCNNPAWDGSGALNGSAIGSFCRMPTTVDQTTPLAALPASCRYWGIDGAYCW